MVTKYLSQDEINYIKSSQIYTRVFQGIRVLVIVIVVLLIFIYNSKLESKNEVIEKAFAEATLQAAKTLEKQNYKYAKNTLTAAIRILSNNSEIDKSEKIEKILARSYLALGDDVYNENSEEANKYYSEIIENYSSQKEYYIESWINKICLFKRYKPNDLEKELTEMVRYFRLIEAPEYQQLIKNKYQTLLDKNCDKNLIIAKEIQKFNIIVPPSE
ncbi:hypothetical protein KKC13_08340 [bacterium]|nr:hypothetical protein [bacterium]MBU1959471.1 hypothetical protein [bacterium]